MGLALTRCHDWNSFFQSRKNLGVRGGGDRLTLSRAEGRRLVGSMLVMWRKTGQIVLMID